MSKVDWSKAPEGAEFYADGCFWKDGKLLPKPAHIYHDYEPRPKEWPSEQRIEHIGQNGATGEHYEAVESTQSDLINNPKHYQLIGGLEAIDVIERTLTPEQFKGYLIGSFLKYRLRAGQKDDALQDLAKSEWYRQRAEGLQCLCIATSEN